MLIDMPNKKPNRRSFVATSTLAVAASSLTFQHPRIHTEGDLTITVDANLPNVQSLVAFGYQVSEGSVGSFNGIERKPTGEVIAAKR
jgi:hypothetical protein